MPGDLCRANLELSIQPILPLSLSLLKNCRSCLFRSPKRTTPDFSFVFPPKSTDPALHQEERKKKKKRKRKGGGGGEDSQNPQNNAKPDTVTPLKQITKPWSLASRCKRS